jgi:hypothetical protein
LIDEAEEVVIPARSHVLLRGCDGGQRYRMDDAGVRGLSVPTPVKRHPFDSLAASSPKWARRMGPCPKTLR